MRVASSKFLRGTRGQSLVEFALILPIFLVVMFMITEFGRALFQYNILVSATRAGARSGVLLGEAAAPAAAIAVADSLLKAADIPLAQVTMQASVVDNFGGNGVKVLVVTADKDFDWIYKGGLTMQGNATVDKPKALSLHAETIMQGEGFQ